MADGAVEKKNTGPDGASNVESKFLDVLILGLNSACSRKSAKNSSNGPSLPGVFEWLDAYSLIRCGRSCTKSRELTLVENVWEPRVRRLCDTWDLTCQKAKLWRRSFLGLLRPRVDGIYVGECRYIHRIPAGASMDPKLSKRSYHWVTYRRYVRLCPPNPHDGSQLAFVLRDVCSVEAAAEVLTDSASFICDGDASTAEFRTASSQLRSRVASGTYLLDGSRVEVRAKLGAEEFVHVFQLRHASDQRFSGQLDWLEYYLIDKNLEVSRFDLGRSTYGDGSPARSDKDHYPSLYIRPCRNLEHFL
eukprot:TRINITY_DN41555_c0_g1_i1.p1 TRINITY_DN41555_c0_g1~~TRINITY_DN41555_c0_g1_i1.p1  ORF type:complete len:351 (-),score=14.48 TRINITY_DN41555_c0_g1_i1:114-1025(-)